MPKISLILACYNSEKTIVAAMNSIRSQIFKNLELIVVDGGSNDATLSILRQNNDLITHLITGPDNGVYDALNKGIMAATGDVIGFLHSDDTFFDPGALNFVNQGFLADPDTLIVYGDLHFFKNDKCVRIWRTSKYSKLKLMLGWVPPHPTCYMRRQVYKDVGLFNPVYKISGDYDHLTRAFLRYGNKSMYLGRPLYKMQVGGISTTASNFFLKFKEDVNVMRHIGLLWPLTIVGKKVSKLFQIRWLNKCK